MKRIITSLAVLAIVSTPSWAPATAQRGAEFTLPANAVKVDEHTYYLGSKRDPQSGKQVEGYAFLRYKDEGAHREGHARPGGGTTSCYAFIGKGAKWKGTAEPWQMNTSNSQGLNEASVMLLQRNAIDEWEAAADGVAGGGMAADVLGSGSTTGNALSVALDETNSVMFGNASGSTTIAVTTVWGIFGGPINQRELVEWDMLFDDVDFDWSAELEGVTGKMDFENIAQHELGHALGLGHPSGGCSEETMYAYASNGETKKRDLNTGDIQGMNALY